MPQRHPELIFVSGPQTGERVAVMHRQVVAGRSPQADMQLTEKFISRKQFQLALTQEGWVFENLSSKPCKINGKKCKSGKAVILDTGDVIEVGMETRLFFVSAEDDADLALESYRANESIKFQVKSASVLTEEPQKPKRSKPRKKPGEAAELSDEEKSERQRKAKLKKYGLIFGIYLAVLVCGAVVLKQYMPRDTQDSVARIGRPKPMSQDEIAQSVSKELSRLRNIQAARDSLAEAYKWLGSKEEPGGLYLANYHFRLARAYGHSESHKEEMDFRKARADLIESIQKRYNAAYKFEMAGDYRSAIDGFEFLLECVPLIRDYDEPIRKNITKHLAFLRREMGRRKRR